MIKIIKEGIKHIQGLYNFYCFCINSKSKIKNSIHIFFFPYYHTGGAERVHLNILQAVKKQKCCVIFTHLSATTNFLDDFKKCAEVIELNSISNKKSSIINSWLLNTITTSINKSKTVKTVFGCNTNYFYEILPYLSDTKKTIDLIHALAPNDHRRLMLSGSAKLLDYRIVINRKTKQDIISIYNEESVDSKYVGRIKVIGNGVNIDRNEIIDFQSKDFKQIRIGFFGRWSEEKRPQIFLEVAKRIKQQFPHVEFLMAGTGMKSNLKQIIYSGAIFLGEITDEKELMNLYKKLNFIVITSVYEGFPMVIMESMIHGVIPICTDVGGIYEHIKNMKNGVLIQNNNEKELVEAFTSKMSYLINNIDVAKNLSNKAFNYSVENFSIEKFNRSYQKLFSL